MLTGTLLWTMLPILPARTRNAVSASVSFASSSRIPASSVFFSSNSTGGGSFFACEVRGGKLSLCRPRRAMDEDDLFALSDLLLDDVDLRPQPTQLEPNCPRLRSTLLAFPSKRRRSNAPAVHALYSSSTSSTSAAALSPPRFRCDSLTTSGSPPLSGYRPKRGARIVS